MGLFIFATPRIRFLQKVILTTAVTYPAGIKAGSKESVLDELLFQ